MAIIYIVKGPVTQKRLSTSELIAFEHMTRPAHTSIQRVKSNDVHLSIISHHPS